MLSEGHEPPLSLGWLHFWGKALLSTLPWAVLKSERDPARWRRPKSCSPSLLLQQQRTPCWLTLAVSGQGYNSLAAVKLPWDFPMPVLKGRRSGFMRPIAASSTACFALHDLFGNHGQLFSCILMPVPFFMTQLYRGHCGLACSFGIKIQKLYPFSKSLCWLPFIYSFILLYCAYLSP